MQLDKHQLDAIYNLSETFKNHDIWNKMWQDYMKDYIKK